VETGFELFQLLHHRQVAEEMGKILDQEGIPYEIIHTRKYFDPSFAFNKVDPDINLRLKPADFSRAREVLESYYMQLVENTEPDYYLFKFTDAELFDIISKPEEWGIFDHALARKIIKDRGYRT
jgi:hypothetical protein